MKKSFTLIGALVLVVSAIVALSSYKEFSVDLFSSPELDMNGLVVNTSVVNAADAEKQIDQAMENSQRVQNIGDLTYESRFIPAGYFVRRELQGKPYSEGLLENYTKNSSFLLRLTADKYNDELLKYKIQSVNDYYQRIEYYSFQVQDDIHLILDEKDTIPCSFHHFERNYGVGPELRLMVNFPIPEKELFQANKVQIVWNDRVFDNGLVKFLFNRSHFTQIEFSNE